MCARERRVIARSVGKVKDELNLNPKLLSYFFLLNTVFFRAVNHARESIYIYRGKKRAREDERRSQKSLKEVFSSFSFEYFIHVYTENYFK